MDQFTLAALIRDTADDVVDEWEARQLTPFDQPPPFAVVIVLTLRRLASKIDGRPLSVETVRQSERAVKRDQDRSSAEQAYIAQLNIAPPVTPP